MFGRVYHYAGPVILAALIFAAISSCAIFSAEIYTWDPLGNQPEKGYVDFNLSPDDVSRRFSDRIDIGELRDGKFENAYLIQGITGIMKRRIAKIAGTYVFHVYVGNSEDIKIEVRKGMVTPVLVTVVSAGPNLYRFFLTPSPPVPYKPGNEYVQTKPVARVF